MGLTPAHAPMQKKQKAAVVTDFWSNDSPVAISRRQWVPLRPAVLNGKGCPMTHCYSFMGPDIYSEQLCRWFYRASPSLEGFTVTERQGYTALQACHHLACSLVQTVEGSCLVAAVFMLPVCAAQASSRWSVLASQRALMAAVSHTMRK